MILNIVIITTASPMQSNAALPAAGISVGCQNILLLQKRLGNWISSSPNSINLQ